ncbi:class I SAM-dependent methyltransferase [Nocardia sp. NPDC003963]
MTDSSGRAEELFAGTAWHYARYRPGYPESLFDDLIRRFRLDGTGRLLDLGCGTGQLTLPLAAHFAEAVGVDPEPEMLAEAARTFEFQRWWTIEQAIGYLYSTSLPLRRLLGDRRTIFEHEVADTLRALDPSGRYAEPVRL